VDLARPIVATGAERQLDHRMLIAAAAVTQAGTRTARLAARIDTGVQDTDCARALVVTFLGTDPVAGPRTLAGSFHPDIADALTFTSMKNGFTVAF
jgi:hypothetical protein